MMERQKKRYRKRQGIKNKIVCLKKVKEVNWEKESKWTRESDRERKRERGGG